MWARECQQKFLKKSKRGVCWGLFWINAGLIQGSTTVVIRINEFLNAQYLLFCFKSRGSLLTRKPLCSTPTYRIKNKGNASQVFYSVCCFKGILIGFEDLNFWSFYTSRPGQLCGSRCWTVRDRCPATGTSGIYERLGHRTLTASAQPAAGAIRGYVPWHQHGVELRPHFCFTLHRQKKSLKHEPCVHVCKRTSIPSGRFRLLDTKASLWRIFFLSQVFINLKETV